LQADVSPPGIVLMRGLGIHSPAMAQGRNTADPTQTHPDFRRNKVPRTKVNNFGLMLHYNFQSKILYGSFDQWYAAPKEISLHILAYFTIRYVPLP